jgi:hypothetical protein
LIFCCIYHYSACFFHNRKHANVDDASAAKAAKVLEDDVEKAKMEWETVQFSDDEGNDANDE